MEIFKLFGSVFVDNAKANESIQQTDTLGEKLGKTFVNGAKVIGTGCLAIGTAAAAVGTAAVKSFGDFEQSLNKVATIADPSVKSMDQIKKEVLALSNDMGTAAEGINEAMYQAISATGDTANALKYVEGASKLAKGGFTDVGKAMDGVTKTMNAYGMTGEEAFGKVSDMLVQTQNLGITTVDELAGSLYNVIPTAASLGVGFDQVSAAMATMTSMGTPTSVATTQLRSAMNELSKSGTKASDSFKDLSGVSFQEFIAQGGNMSDAMVIMQEGATNAGLTIGDMFGSVEAGAAALALTGDGATKFNESLVAMNDSAGATQAAYEQMSQGVNASFEKLINAGKNVLIGLGDKLAPTMVEVADWINGHMPEIQAVIEVTFDVIGGVIDTCVEWISKLLEWLDDLLLNNQEVTDGIQKVWEEAKVFLDIVLGKWQELITTFIDWCIRFWDKWGKDITVVIQTTWNLVESIFSTAFNVIGGVIDLFISAMNGDFEGMKKAVTDIMDSLWEGIKDIFSASIDWIFKLVPRMFKAGADLVSGLWDGWKSIWSGMQEWIKEKCDWMLDKLMFWRKSGDEMESGKQSSDGSHKNGLNYVPWDGYTATLHRAEAVLTEEDNREWQAYKRGDISISNKSAADTSKMESLLEQLVNKLDKLPRDLINEERLVRG